MVCNHSFDVCIEFVYWSLLSQKVLLWYFTEFRAGIEHYAKGWYVNSSLLIEVTQKCILKSRSFFFALEVLSYFLRLIYYPFWLNVNFFTVSMMILWTQTIIKSCNHHDDRYVFLWRLGTFIVLNYLYKHLQTYSFYFINFAK